MRATIQFINPDKKFAILTKLLKVIRGITNLRQHILAHGILLEKLGASEVEALQKTLSRHSHFSYLTSHSSIRVLIADGELRALLGLVMPIPRRQNEFTDIFWKKGFTIEKLVANQAEELRKQLEAIATVIITEDAPQTHFCMVSGQVAQRDGVPLSVRGFTVRAFDSFSTDDLVPCGTTAALQINGLYLIDYAWQSDGRKGPDLLVHVLDRQGNIVAEAKKPSAAIQEFLDITAPQLCIVRGTILEANGYPLPGVVVQAFDRDMREEALLGRTLTDAEGFYEITYSNAQFRRPEKGQADLIVRVFDADEKGEGEEITVSDMVFNAPQLQIINLEVESRSCPSEYERHLADLKPLIEGEPVDALTDEDLRFLSGKTGIPFEQINCLRLDARWSFQHGLKPAVAYGLFRQELPVNLRRLLAEKPARLREALEASLAHNIIPAAIGLQTDQAVEQLLSLADSLVIELDRKAK
ncbi:MAG: hypothetical protein H0X43_02400 [Nitrosospira sp.]|nr:hypothetical protein [Nitrosospira sp.]